VKLTAWVSTRASFFDARDIDCRECRLESAQIKYTTMSQTKHEWMKTKTGLLVRDISNSKLPGHKTGISEHGQRLHFPPSFLMRKADHAEIAWATKLLEELEVKWTKKEAKAIKTKIDGLKKMGFHVITSNS
jgi:hypothetical protein